MTTTNIERELKKHLESIDENNVMDEDKVRKWLKSIFIEDKENFDMFYPFNNSKRVKKPGKKMKGMLEAYGFDFVSDGVALEQMEYKFKAVTGYGDNFGYKVFIIDYWNDNCFIEYDAIS